MSAPGDPRPEPLAQAASEAAADAWSQPSLPRGRRARRALGSLTTFRVVMAGPVGVGKTTAVAALSEIDPVGTEMPLTPGADGYLPGAAKTTTTVGLDYGLWHPSPEVSVALVGMPGQARFAEARASVTAPFTRVVLWLFGDRPDLVKSAEEWLDLLGPAALPRLVIALTRTEDGGAAGRSALAPVLAARGGQDVPILAGDPREQESISSVVGKALDLPEEHA